MSVHFVVASTMQQMYTDDSVIENVFVENVPSAMRWRAAKQSERFQTQNAGNYNRNKHSKLPSKLCKSLQTRQPPLIDGRIALGCHACKLWRSLPVTHANVPGTLFLPLRGKTAMLK